MPERRQLNNRRRSDRRQSARETLFREIRFLSAASPTTVWPGRLEDVSTTGLRLMLEQSVPTGEKLLIEVRDSARTVCNVTVEVVWSEADASGQYGIGCESLTELSARQMSQLKAAAGRRTVPL